MEIHKQMTLQEFMKSDYYQNDEVEINFHGQWLPLYQVQTSYVENCTWYSAGVGKVHVGIDKNDHILDAYTPYDLRITVDDEDIDNPHVPEDDFIATEGIVDRIKSGYWELRVDYEPYVDSSVVAFTLFLHSRIGTIEMDTFCDYSETTDLYDLSSRSWNHEAVSCFWDGLSVCQQ